MQSHCQTLDRRPVSPGSTSGTHSFGASLTDTSRNRYIQYKCALTYSCTLHRHHNMLRLYPHKPIAAAECRATVKQCFDVQLRLSSLSLIWFIWGTKLTRIFYICIPLRRKSIQSDGNTTGMKIPRTRGYVSRGLTAEQELFKSKTFTAHALAWHHLCIWVTS